MFCPQCGSHRPDRANFCASCGRTLKQRATPAQMTGQHQWEYSEVAIPVLIQSRDSADLERRFDELILRHLQRLGQEGWQADEPTDAWSLHQDLRLVGGVDSRIFHWRKAKWSLSGSGEDGVVTIRLKRLVP